MATRTRRGTPLRNSRRWRSEWHSPPCNVLTFDDGGWPRHSRFASVQPHRDDCGRWQSIGYHQHLTNEDTYVIMSGHGMFKDKDGKDYPGKAGDVTIVRKGESHGLADTGKEPRVFVDVIAER